MLGGAFGVIAVSMSANHATHVIDDDIKPGSTARLLADAVPLSMR